MRRFARNAQACGSPTKTVIAFSDKPPNTWPFTVIRSAIAQLSDIVFFPETPLAIGAV